MNSGISTQGGFRLASPVKLPHASEPPRCAPPHTNRAGEEPEEGGRDVAQAETPARDRALRRRLPTLKTLDSCRGFEKMSLAARHYQLGRHTLSRYRWV